MSTTNINRRMTLSGIPSQRSSILTNRRDSIVPSPTSGNGNVQISKNGQRPIPKSRKSMIPTLGRENVPTNSTDNNNSNSKNKNDAYNSSDATSVRKVSKVRRSSIIPQNPTPVLTYNNDSVPIRNNNSTNSNGNSDRRGSILPPPPPFPHAHGMMKQEKDPRIVSDNKPLQQKCIRDLLDYLLDHGYQYPVSQKSLSRPSAKEFSNILTFMLRRVDPNFQNNSQMKFEDEVALNFKCLGYPCSISKTALVAAGTAHTWPSLLAALTWLMERLQCIELDKEEDMLHNPQGTTFESIEELVVKSETAFYQYLGKSYAAFLTENMQELEQMEVALSNRFMKDDEVLEQHIERITDVNTSIIEQIRKLEHESTDLPLYAKKREDYAVDLEQFHDLIRQMDDHKSMLEKKVKEKKAELAKTNVQLEKCSNDVDELKRVIATQELSIDEVQKIESEIKGIHEALDRTAAVKEQRRKNVAAHEEELIKFCFTVDSVVTSFNAKLIDLLEVPELVSILKNKKLCFNRDNLLLDDQREILGADIQQQVQPLILKYQDDYVERLSKGKEQYQDEMDEMESTVERNKVVFEELSVLKDKKIKMEQKLSSEMEIANATLAIRQRELDTIEQKVTSLRDPVAFEEQLATYDRQCVELESLRMDQQEENIAKKKSVVEEINTACAAMKDYENKFNATMENAVNYWNAKRETLRSYKVTTNIN